MKPNPPKPLSILITRLVIIKILMMKKRNSICMYELKNMLKKLTYKNTYVELSLIKHIGKYFNDDFMISENRFIWRSFDNEEVKNIVNMSIPVNSPLYRHILSIIIHSRLKDLAPSTNVKANDYSTSAARMRPEDLFSADMYIGNDSTWNFNGVDSGVIAGYLETELLLFKVYDITKLDAITTRELRSIVNILKEQHSIYIEWTKNYVLNIFSMYRDKGWIEMFPSEHVSDTVIKFRHSEINLEYLNLNDLISQKVLEPLEKVIKEFFHIDSKGNTNHDEGPR